MQPRSATKSSIEIGLTGPQRVGCVDLLKPLLADEYLLYTKTRNYHWNVTGPHFHELHKFFEAQYTDLDGKIDEVAEFIRSLGERSPGSLSEFLKAARLKESSSTENAQGMIGDLLAAHEAVIRQLRGDITKAADEYQAADVADFLTGLAEDHQKMAWMLRAMLE